MASLFEILLNDQAQRMCLSTVCEREVISQRSSLLMRNKALKSHFEFERVNLYVVFLIHIHMYF